MSPKSEKSIKQLEKIVKEDSEKRKFIRPKEGTYLYSMSRTKFDELATKAGAVYRLGKVVLINVKVFEEYLEQHRLSGEED